MSNSTKTAKAVTPAKSVVAEEAVIVAAQAQQTAENVAPVGTKPAKDAATKPPSGNFKKIRGGQVYELNLLGPRTLHFSEVGKMENGKRVTSTIMLKIFRPDGSEDIIATRKLSKVLFLGKNAEKMSSWISEALDFEKNETPYTNIEQG